MRWLPKKHCPENKKEETIVWARTIVEGGSEEEQKGA